MNALVAVLVTSTTGTALVEAQPRQPWAPSSSLEMGASAALSSDSDALGGLRSMGAVDFRLRALAGKSVAYCLGFDGSAGASNEGSVYSANAYLLGIGLRIGGSSYVAVCAGAGLGGASSAVPFAWQFPVELKTELQLGPVRLHVYTSLTWTEGARARVDGSETIGIADEVTIGANLRLGRAKSFWSSTTAGHGYYLGAQVKELMGTQLIGLALGVGFWGGQ